jgi:hypothetical protein
MHPQSLGEKRREPSQRPRTYEYCGEAFVKEFFAGKGRRWKLEPFRRAGRSSLAMQPGSPLFSVDNSVR